MARRNKKGRGSTKKKRGGKSKQQSPVAPVAAQPQQEAPMFRFDGDTNRQPEPVQSVVDDSAPIFRFGVPKQSSSKDNNEEGEPNITTTTQAPTSVKVSEDACDQQISSPPETKEVHSTNTHLRFAVGDKVDCHNCETEEWDSGTVIFRNGNAKPLAQNTSYQVLLAWKGSTRDNLLQNAATYHVRLDSGMVAAVPLDSDKFIKLASNPRKFKVFKGVERVECIWGGEWVAAKLLSCARDWVDIDPAGAPYIVQIDGMGLPYNIYDQDRIRMVQVAKKKALRFDVGQRVECYVGGRSECRWMSGTIIKTHYKENEFEDGFVAPYQIKLDTGGFIFAPFDDDDTIRKNDTPAPTCWICYEAEQSRSNSIVRECACRGEANGYVHVECLVKLAIAKADNKHQEGIDDENPFTQCITCKQEFRKGSQSFHCLAVGCLKAFGGEADIGKPWNGLATSMAAIAKHAEGDSDIAIEFLLYRCKMLTAKRHDKSVQLSCKEVFQMDLDFARLLGDLAIIYEEKGELDNMKNVLDKSLFLIKKLEKGTPSRRKVNILSLLATHAYLVGDLNVAIERYEECISLTRGQAKENDMLLATLLLRSGNLELELGNTERGIEQIIESVDIMKVVYGRNHIKVVQFAECLDTIQKGLLEKIPKKLMRLDFSVGK